MFQSDYDGLTYDTTTIDGPATLDEVTARPRRCLIPGLWDPWY